MQWVGRWACRLPRNGATRTTLYSLGFAPTDYVFDDMVARCQGFIHEGLAELERRMNY